MNEIDKFFGDLPTDDKTERDIFGDGSGKPKASEEGVLPENGEGEGGEGKGEEFRKNRRHRRLEEKMRQKDEMLIALNERVRVLSEVKNQEGFTPGQMPAEWVALYGDTPEAKTAWAMQERLLKEHREQAKKEAIAEFREEQANAIKQQKEFESFIDTELEDLEEEFNIDLTSNAPAAKKARREFLELVQKVSPKDENGNVTGYADFASTFELYKNQKAAAEKPNTTVNRQKEIAAQSMQESGQGKPAQKAPTPGFHGWKKDYGL